MWQNFFLDASFFSKLLEVDWTIAEQVRQKGCPFCGGPLHQAHYPRKPRGGPDEIDDTHRLRLSFCCGREGCRKRMTPPSARFLGRKVYFAPVVILLTILLDTRPFAAIRNYGAKRRTVYRWRHWWRDEFTKSRIWKNLKGLLSPPPEPVGLPGQLLDRFPGSLMDRMASCLSFLAPIGATLIPPIGQGF